jgi:hypothetical protein
MRAAYGFSDPRGFLDDNGYVIDDTKSGLTCSTLVLAVFEHVGHTLLSYDHWCYGPEDQAERQRYIASYAAKNPKEPEQIYRLESEAASYRYAPLQVAGAAMSARPPASFDEAESNGKSIRRLLERRRFRRPP